MATAASPSEAIDSILSRGPLPRKAALQAVGVADVRISDCLGTGAATGEAGHDSKDCEG